MVQFRWRLVLLSGLVLAAGCHRGPATTVLSGEVRFAGQPIENGEIGFFPIEGTPGGSTAAAIAEGRYALAVRGGVRIDGVYLVRIVGFKDSDRKVHNKFAPSRQLVPEKENFIPAIYNTASTMKVRVFELAKKDKVDFQLEKPR